MTVHAIRHEGEIYHITFSADIKNRTYAEPFFNDYERIVRQHPHERPFDVLIDTSAIAVKSWTEYIRERTEQADKLVVERGLYGMAAIVIDDSLPMRLFRIFFERRMRRRNPKMVSKFFFGGEEALAWLAARRPD